MLLYPQAKGVIEVADWLMFGMVVVVGFPRKVRTSRAHGFFLRAGAQSGAWNCLFGVLQSTHLGRVGVCEQRCLRYRALTHKSRGSICVFEGCFASCLARQPIRKTPSTNPLPPFPLPRLCVSSPAGGGDTAAAMSLLLLYRLVGTDTAAPIGFSCSISPEIRPILRGRQPRRHKWLRRSS